MAPHPCYLSITLVKAHSPTIGLYIEEDVLVKGPPTEDLDLSTDFDDDEEDNWSDFPAHLFDLENNE